MRGIDGNIWDDPSISGDQPNMGRDTNMQRESVPGEQIRNHQLHNTSDVNGYDIVGSDGEIGDVKDFIIDEEKWVIRYLIVDTGGWLPGKKVLIAPEWIERVSKERFKKYSSILPAMRSSGLRN